MSPTMLTYINEESDVGEYYSPPSPVSGRSIAVRQPKNVTTNPDISHRIVIECRLLRPLFL